MKSPFFMAVVGLVALFISGAASATLINVDFQGGSNTYSGQGVLGDTSDTIWNPVSNSAPDLLLADGTGASGVSVSVSGFVGNFSNGSQANPILNDWLYGLGNLMTISIEGLAANSTFNLAFYNGFYWQDFTVPGQAGLIASTRPNRSSSAGAPPFSTDKYAILQNVMSDANGAISILDTPMGGSFGLSSSIAGLQIQQVRPIPEPSTLAIFALGLLGLALGIHMKQAAVQRIPIA
jgi:hypothetical protein